MRKARWYLAMVVGMVFSLLGLVPAYAYDQTHGSFSSSTFACAGCHVIHAANVGKLLKGDSDNQTAFCFLCHADGGTSAPYDVANGVTYTGTGGSSGSPIAQFPSVAGGFYRQWQGGNTYKTVTSRHNVFGMASEGEGELTPGTPPTISYPGGRIWFIPGSTRRYQNATEDPEGTGFRCSSCHDPHAGGRAPGTNGLVSGDDLGTDAWTGTTKALPNPRLLRKYIQLYDPDQEKEVTNSTPLVVAFEMQEVGNWTISQGTSHVLKTTGYVKGSADWCGYCHDKFKVPKNSGRERQNENDLFRHAMGFEITPDTVKKYGPPNNPTINGTPLEGPADGSADTNPTQGTLGCLTCHRAHSSAADMEGFALNPWPRSEGTWEGDSDIGQRHATSSVLLRMNNRGVCYSCHWNVNDQKLQNLPGGGTDRQGQGWW